MTHAHRLAAIVAVALTVSACATQSRWEQTTPLPGVLPPTAGDHPSGMKPRKPKKVVYDRAGYFILPDGTRVRREDGGGFHLPNGEYARPDGLGGVRLPNGSLCTPDGADGYLCP